MDRIIFVNARTILPDCVKEGCRVSVKDGVIETLDWEFKDDTKDCRTEVIDCEGNNLYETAVKEFRVSE